MPPSEAADVIGRFPIGRVPAGTMLTPGMFADDVPLGADEMVFGAALDPGESPLSDLQVGAPSSCCRSPLPTPAGAPAAAARRPRSGAGTVWAVEPIATGQLWVSMRVPATSAPASLAQRPTPCASC